MKAACSQQTIRAYLEITASEDPYLHFQYFILLLYPIISIYLYDMRNFTPRGRDDLGANARVADVTGSIRIRKTFPIFQPAFKFIIMAAIQPLEFRWGIISTGHIASAFVKVRNQILRNPALTDTHTTGYPNRP